MFCPINLWELEQTKRVFSNTYQSNAFPGLMELPVIELYGWVLEMIYPC